MQSALITPATRNGADDWQSRLKMRETNGVHHAVDNKGAFLYVTSTSTLKLVYQQESQSWAEASYNLGDLIDSDELLTHAAFGDGAGQSH